MSRTTTRLIQIDDLEIQLTYKPIRGMHLRLLPPHGSIHISAPLQYPEARVIAFVRSKLEWIKKHQERIRQRPWKPALQYQTGEKHVYLGKEYVLVVVEKRGKSEVRILDANLWSAKENTIREMLDPGYMIAQEKHTMKLEHMRVPDSSTRRSIMKQGELFESAGSGLRMTSEGVAGSSAMPTLVLCVPKGTGKRKRKEVLEHWYKEQLQGIVPELFRRYEGRMGVSAAQVRYRSMKSRWGSCAIRKRSITLNTELAKKSLGAIEAVVVHELTHLKERGHNARFYQLMSEYYPEWKTYEKELKTIDS